MKLKKLLMLLTIFLTTSVVAQGPEIELMHKALAFEKHWDVYIRNLFGCKPAPEVTSPYTCNPSIGFVDYAAFIRSRSAAAKLFEFKE